MAGNNYRLVAAISHPGELLHTADVISALEVVNNSQNPVRHI